MGRAQVPGPYLSITLAHTSRSSHERLDLPLRKGSLGLELRTLETHSTLLLPGLGGKRCGGQNSPIYAVSGHRQQSQVPCLHCRAGDETIAILRLSIGYEEEAPVFSYLGSPWMGCGDC